MPVAEGSPARRLREPIVAALGDRLEEVCGRLNHWGHLCIEAGAFPPDILKRAAG